MPNLTADKLIRNFLDEFSEFRLFSTGFEIVENFTGDLYNVRRSSDDPEIDGRNWKQLLIDEAALSPSDECYVTSPDADPGSNHPEFFAGGHMTTDSDGSVPVGGNCYLMPICAWHNHYTRTGRFEHTGAKMLMLTGYMEGDLFSTFKSRINSIEPFALLYLDQEDGTWKHKNLSKEVTKDIDSKLFHTKERANQCMHRVLIERDPKTQQLKSIVEANLPTIE